MFEHMGNAYFSKGIRKEILSYLKEARKSVNVAMAWFTSSELFNGLLECLKRNVKVELILLKDAINFMEYAPNFNKFIEEGGTLRITEPPVKFMHHKFCLIDNNITITGSYNWTHYAENRNEENIIITDNPFIANKYLEEFKRLKNILQVSTSSPRLTYEQIAHEEHYIDFEMLNYEIKEIAELEHKTVRTVVKASIPKVEIRSIPLNPKSKYVIGILLEEGWKNLIEEGTKLPFYKKYSFMNHRPERKDINFALMSWNDDPSEDFLLFERQLSELTLGRDDWQLHFDVSINLDTNGYLHVIVSCLETGKSIDLQHIDERYVSYES